MTKFYAAEISYVLRDMRPCIGPFATLKDAELSAHVLTDVSNGHVPRDDANAGDYFAVHGPGLLSMVDGPYPTQKKADAERKVNSKDACIGNGDPGFVAVVSRVVALNPKNSKASVIILESLS